MKLNKKIIMLNLALITVVAALALSGCGTDSDSTGDSTISESNAGNELPQMPEFSLEKLGGGQITSEDLLGKPTVINFEASWCGPCEFEAPTFAAAHASYPDVSFVGIAVKDTEADQQRFVDKFGWTFPIGLDFTGIVVTDFQKEALMPRGAIPTTFFVDSLGNIVDVYIGPISETDLAELIAALLAADAAVSDTTGTTGDMPADTGASTP